MLTAAAMATTTSAPTATAALARRLNRPTGGETAVIAMSFPRWLVIAKDAEKALADSWRAAGSRGAEDLGIRQSRRPNSDPTPRTTQQWDTDPMFSCRIAKPAVAAGML